ncbi:MAG: carboxypeptidase regulatory-like domain-containing protein [Armatimonadota bacterium]|nr:carboxypeptidase regulatory-like domain-containing protein [Armatimonadota bacterium]
MGRYTSLNLFLLLLLLQGHALANGQISGRVTDLLGRGVYEIAVWASSSETGYTYSAGTATDGSYTLTVPAGTYTVGLRDPFHFRVQIRHGVVVRDGRTTPLNFTLYNTVWTDDPTWFVHWHRVYAQSFIADGTSVVKVTARVASEPTTINVSIHEGGPEGSQVGPTRSLYAGHSGRGTASWHAGEVPVVPGRRYTVVLRRPDNAPWSTYMSRPLYFGADAYPDGHAFVDGSPLPDLDLGITISCDDDGHATFYHVRHNDGGRWVGEAVQSFVARGSSLTSVSFTTGAVSQVWFAVSVHTAPIGGQQVGAVRYVRGWSDVPMMVCWAPGEVPLRQGQTYYLRIRRTTGEGFYIYLANNAYRDGVVYLNGVVQSGLDLGSCVMTSEEASGAVKPRLLVHNLMVSSVGTRGASLYWRTNVPASSHVEYGEELPYAKTVSDPSPKTIHEVTLSGLEPHTLYHIRARSRAEGYLEGKSGDYTLLTLPEKPNLLVNGGFETGTPAGWTFFGASDGVYQGPWFKELRAVEGRYFIGWATNGSVRNGGVWQRVRVTPGREYQFSAWAWTWCWNIPLHNLAVRIGIDPFGRTDPNAPTVVWTPWSVHYDRWHPLWVRARAQSDFLTVFLQGHADSPAEWNIYAFDDAILTERVQRFRVSGRVTLSDFVASPEGVPVQVQIRPAGSASPLRSETVLLDGAGRYTLLEVEPGEYDLAFKASHWLRAVVRGVRVVSADVQGVDVLLPNGDVDGDNEVTLTDFGQLLSAFGSIPGEPAWNPNADLDGDGEVNLVDFGILVRSFGLVGAE